MKQRISPDCPAHTLQRRPARKWCGRRARPQVSCTWQSGDVLLWSCSTTRRSPEASKDPWRTHKAGGRLAPDLGVRGPWRGRGCLRIPTEALRETPVRWGGLTSGRGSGPASGAPRPPRAHTHTHHPARPGAARPDPAASPRSPARRAPGRSFLLCSLFPAQCPPRPAPPGPSAASRALLGEEEGAGAGADGTGVAAAAGRAQPRRHSPRRSHPPLLRRLAPRLSPALPQRPRGGAAGARLGNPGSPPGRRSHSQASLSGAHALAVQTLGPAATCSRPEARTRCAPRSRAPRWGSPRCCCSCCRCGRSPREVSGGPCSAATPPCRCAPGRAAPRGGTPSSS